VARGDDGPSRRLESAKVWGEITTAAQRHGRPRPFNNSWIAACRIEGGLPLLTLNRRDFVDFAEQDGLVLLGAQRGTMRSGWIGRSATPRNSG
jgi:hypothetical protein